jgi:parallel beta-helix repeat protein
MNTVNSTVVNNTVVGTGNAYYSIEQQSSGIYVERANNNTIKANTLSSNYNGILFVESTGNLVVENTIKYCANSWGSSVGMAFWDAPNNKVYHNNFLNNTNNAYGGVTVDTVGTAPLAANSWDNGFPSGGNYWSDYQTKHPDAQPLNGIRIGNIAYGIDDVNQDIYPLLEPYDVASQPTPTPTPSTPLSTEQTARIAPILIAVAIAILVIAGLAVAVYFKKR